MIVLELIYMVAAVMLAAIHAHLIKEGKVKAKWLHMGTGALHLIVAGLVGWFIWWGGFFCILCNTRIVFDTSLNKFRGLDLNYIPEKPNSWVDQGELHVFGRDYYTPRLIYLGVSVLLNLIYYIWL